MNYNYKNLLFNNFKKISYKDLLIFLIPFSVFMTYLYIYNPGILSYDSYNQLNQIATHTFSSHHPFFHTFIEMLCLKVYNSPLSVAVFQILTFSTMWSIICKYNRQDTSKINKEFILQIIISLIISLIPINAIYSIILWKDVLYSYSLMFLCFLIEVMLDRNCELSKYFILLISVVMAVTWQLRANGKFAILITLILLAVYLFKKNKKQKLYLIIPAVTLVFVLLISSLNVVYDVTNEDIDAVFIKTSHILADYDLNINMSPEDSDKVHELISRKDIEENFRVCYTDPIFHVSNKKVYDRYKNEYYGLILKYSIKNPRVFIQYLLKSSLMVWDITRDDDWFGCSYNTNIKSINNYNNITAKNIGTYEYNKLNSFVYLTRNNHILDTLFNSPALYMYLSFILMIIIHILTKSKSIYLVYLPNLLSIFTIILSTPVQDNRYLYANLLVFYLILVIFLRTYKKYGKESILKFKN